MIQYKKVKAVINNKTKLEKKNNVHKFQNTLCVRNTIKVTSCYICKYILVNRIRYDNFLQHLLFNKIRKK